jgi:hypothetical protein
MTDNQKYKNSTWLKTRGLSSIGSKVKKVQKRSIEIRNSPKKTFNILILIIIGI